ncbi:winged helix-turn-helix transcriptional regulator [Aureivirga sp. CE67]|uniref:winged helix-turn-helix transcriptional regulator n=1 Tax=Aureivirga sp. CE67 TaxID=1788983 RepID=UPI0018C9AC90|nr:helix-turn-helix domain-containing protein [Aureivirga sp. CE67]
MARKYLENPNSCPVVHTINLIGGKWKPLILYNLEEKSVRFGKLHFLIPNISRKVLTEQLRELESDGLINRKKYNESPPRVEYSLTEKTKQLVPILRQLGEWSYSFSDKEFVCCEVEKEEAVATLN